MLVIGTAMPERIKCGNESWPGRAHKGRAARGKFANSKIEARSVEHGKLLLPAVFSAIMGLWVTDLLARWQSCGGNVSWLTHYFPFL